MGVNAEGKISLSVELANFKDIAGNLKKGITRELKEIPLDIHFDDKELEKEAANIMNKINELLSKGKITGLDFSEILPSFFSALQKEGKSDKEQLEMMKGFESSLINLKEIGIKQDYDLLKLFNGEELKTYLEDLNNIVDAINLIEGLSKRQKEGLLNTTRPDTFPLTGKENRGKAEEYTKGAKKISGMLALKDKYSDVIQYATSPDVTSKMIEDLSKKTNLTKKDAEDYLGYLLRAKYLEGLNPNSDLKITKNFDALITPLKEKLKEEVVQRITNNTTALFNALDEVYNSSNIITNYSDLFEEGSNTTNSKYKGMYDATKSELPILNPSVEDKIAASLVDIKPNEGSQNISKYGEEISKLESQIQEMEQKLKDITQQKKELEKEIGNLDVKKKEITDKIKIKENTNARNIKRISYAEKNIEISQSGINDLEQQINNLKEQKKQLEEKLQQLKDEENAEIEQYDRSTKEIEELLKKKEESKKQLQKKITDNEGWVSDSKKKIDYFNEALEGDFSSTGKEDAYRKLKAISDKYRKFESDPNSFPDKNKDDLKNKLIVSYSKALKEAKEQGVAKSRISKELLFPDDEKFSLQVQLATATLEQKRGYEKTTLSRAQDRIANNLQLIKDVEKEEEELQNELKRISEAGYTEQDFINQRANKKNQQTLESEINQRDNKILDLENQITQKKALVRSSERTIEDIKKEDNSQEIQQLKEEQKTVNELYEQKSQHLKELDEQIDKLLKQSADLEKKKDKLSDAQQKLNEKNEPHSQPTKQENVEDTPNNTTNGNIGQGMSNVGGGVSISPEKLEEIITLLGKIQTALGTLDENSDVPSITQSVNNLVIELSNLKLVLDEISKKEVNLNIGLGNNNPIADQGKIKRETLKQLEQQYNELNNYFVDKYGSDDKAINALRKLNGGDRYVYSLMEDLPIASDKNAPLASRIESYKNIIDQLRNFIIQEGGDLNSVLSNALSPDEIITKVNEDLANVNPAQSIMKLFENMRASINTSLSQLNIESSGFNILGSSAEEAAEAKRQFVEANKEVLESIVASMPKIQEETQALEKVNEIKQDAITDTSSQQKEPIFIEEEEQVKQAEEIAKREVEVLQQKKEIQQQYENQFQSWGSDGQLSFLDKNDYDLQSEYLEQQKQEVEELAKQAEQNPIKVDIPIEGQLSFNNEQDIRQIANEIYENSFIEDANGQYSLFHGVEEAANWGYQLKENLQESAKTDFSNLKGQLSLKDWETTIDERNRKLEESYKKTSSSKEFIQSSDLTKSFLKPFENLPLTESTEKLIDNLTKLEEIKNKLSSSFDDKGTLIGDPVEVENLLNQYRVLVDENKKLQLTISSPSSEENIARKLAEDAEKARIEMEKLQVKMQQMAEKSYSSLISSKGFGKEQSSIESILMPFGDLKVTESTQKLSDIGDEIERIKAELSSSFDSQNKLIGDPQKVQELIAQYKNLIKEIDVLKAKISSPISEENMALKLTRDAEKAFEEIEKLKRNLDIFFAAKKDEGFVNQYEAMAKNYGSFADKKQITTDSLIDTAKVDESLRAQQDRVKSLLELLEQYKTAVNNLRTEKDAEIINPEKLTEANEKVKLLEEQIKQLGKTIKTTGTANVSDLKIDDLTKKLEDFIKTSPRLTDEVKTKLEGYIATLKSGTTISKASYNSMAADLRQFATEQRNSLSVWSMMSLKIKEGIAFLSTKFTFYQIFNQFRQGMNTVREFDDALTEMMKVSDETRLSLERYQKTTFEVADAIGTSALQVQQSTADWMRLGETLDEAAKSAQASTILMNVSEFDNISSATESLVAMSQAYKELDKMTIIDKLNEVGNNYAVSTAEAATALQASASALKTAGKIIARFYRNINIANLSNCWKIFRALYYNN